MYSNCLFLACLLGWTRADLPTLYEYYTADNITDGLSDKQTYFTLNNKNFTIYSGALHYFRVPRAYWRDRLRKIRAAGLNTVETYIAWSLHQPYSAVFNFGDGDSEHEDFLHLTEFIRTAQEEDLFVIIRAGPYIDAQFGFGGLPSWITKRVITVRDAIDPWYTPYFRRWFDELVPILAPLQFQRGGAIILLQLENQLGNLGINDFLYKNNLLMNFRDNDIIEMLCTIDPTSNKKLGNIRTTLQTTNVLGDPKTILDELKWIQDDKPPMVMELYTAGFDHWSENHHQDSPTAFKSRLKGILDYPASVNIYMFVGGTTFGFLNGGTGNNQNSSGFLPVITSYDYDAPISESGSYTTKYEIIKEAIAASNTVETKQVDPPEATVPIQYPSIDCDGQILLATIIEEFPEKIHSEEVLAMEQLDINNKSGQIHGYIAYRKIGIDLPPGSVLKISGYVRDTLLVLLNGELISGVPTTELDLERFGFWNLFNSTLTLNAEALNDATLDLVVENFGRNSQADIYLKGLTDPVYINEEQIWDWEIVPLEFKKSWNNALEGWSEPGSRIATPALYHFSLDIEDEPQDTFVDMQKWTKGITIVNGFVLGRHFFIGPQQTLYLPGPFLRQGTNDIVVFEHYNAPEQLEFSSRHIWVTIE